jgi:hypothetical protein
MNPMVIGRIVHVGSSRIDVLITTKELNVTHGGRHLRVGQLGSYVTIPLPQRKLMGYVTGSRQEEDGAAGAENARLLMSVQLLGEITDRRFSRGVTEYPIIGDEVCLATREEFAVIFGSFDDLLSDVDHPQSFALGRFALSTDFEVKILGSPFFAKHVAVLGNSGSGKSCTTAKILQEILDLRQAQVVLFDMHGEYRSAFTDEAGQLDANVTYLGVEDLVLPYWLLRYEELDALFVDRSNPLYVTTQISFLRKALLEFKHDAARDLGLSSTLTLDTPIYFSLQMLKTYAENLNDARFVLNDDHYAFSQLALRSLNPLEQEKLMRTQRCAFKRGNPEGETPHPLYFGKLLGFIDRIDTMYQDRRFEFLMRPIEHGLTSRFFREELKDQSSAGRSSNLMNHLIKVLTGRIQPRSNLTLIDLSGIPFEVVDVTVAVLTRLLFDLNFWTPAHERHPILLAYEEAHNYIPREATGPCFAKRVVERVAKEGRKYGVSAMVISQRPAELSETVLAQCNSLVVMRLSNPEDQKYVAKVVSDHFASMIEVLPILRPGEAFVIGDSVLMPMRTLIELPDRLPQSGDVDFFKFWSSYEPTNDVDRTLDHWRRQDRRAVRDGAQAPGNLEVAVPAPEPAAVPRTPNLYPAGAGTIGPRRRPGEPTRAAGS